MKKAVMLCCVVLCICLASCSDSNAQPESITVPITNTTEPAQIETTVEVVPVIEYDALQCMFMAFTLNTTEEDSYPVYGIAGAVRSLRRTDRQIKIGSTTEYCRTGRIKEISYAEILWVR